MKKNLAIYIVIALMTFSFTANSYGQIGDWIKLAQDAFEKKKSEREKTNEPSQENKQSESTTDPKPQDDLLRVTPSSIGTIYFSNKPFGVTNDGGKTSFTTGEYIYGRLETSGGSLRDVLKFSPITNENPRHKLNINLYLYYVDTVYSVDGFSEALRGGSFVILTEADLDKTYWNFDVLPEPAKATTRAYLHDNSWFEAEDGGPNGLYKYLKETAEEKIYTVIIEFQKKTTDFRGNEEPQDKWLTVEGRAAIDFKTADYAKIKTDAEQMMADGKRRLQKRGEDEENAELEAKELPQAWTLKSSPLLPGLTESGLKEMYERAYSNDWAENQIIKFYAAPYSSTAKTVVANELGIPKHRFLDQLFTVFVKVVDENKNKCWYHSFYLAQAYSGAGTYSQGYFAILNWRVDISCAKIRVK